MIAVRRLGIHFVPSINKRLSWISHYAEGKYQNVTSFEIYWVMASALEQFLEGYPVNRRRKWHWEVNHTGTRRWTDWKGSKGSP